MKLMISWVSFGLGESHWKGVIMVWGLRVWCGLFWVCWVGKDWILNNT